MTGLISIKISMLHQRHKHDLIVILSVAGFGVSLFLAITKILSVPVPCGVTRGCEEVLYSRYAVLFGLPLGVWGTAFFSGIIIAGLLANHYKIWRRLLSLGLGLGSLMALSFIFIQFFVLKKVCQYCLTVDLLTIFLLVWDLNIDKSEKMLKNHSV